MDRGGPMAIPIEGEETVQESGPGNALNWRLKLNQWLSPAFPVGAFAFSHGLEQAVEWGHVRDADTCSDWIRAAMLFGSCRNDGILLVWAYRAQSGKDAVRETERIADLARAFAGSAERLGEMDALGEAFRLCLAGVWGGRWGDWPYPVVLGAAAARHGMGMDEVLGLYFQAFVSNLAAAAIRLVPLGQVEAQKIVARLGALIPDLVAEVAQADESELEECCLGGCALGVDMAAMGHENQKVRLFRT